MHWEKVWTIRWFLVLSSCWAAPVAAVTISYDAMVTFADGPQSAVFPGGETLAISYTLDPLAADSNGDPRRGFFNNAVLSLSVSFPTIGVSAVAGAAGLAQTFDNVVDAPSGTLSDQVFIFGGPISSTSLLGGELISSIEIDFLSRFVALPAEPMMLDSDALPLFELVPADAFVQLHTNSGVTVVNFALSTATASPSVAPTPTATPSPTVTPKPSTGGGGCAIDASDRTVPGNAWIILLPALVLLARLRTPNTM